MCGQTLDRYEIVEWIGGGGFGAVYRARHTVMRREVALKLVRPSVHHPPDVIERFVTEARAAASIGNPHIIGVFDAGSIENGTHFLAMELVKGSSLGQVLSVEGRLSVERVGRIILQVLDALIAAHVAGIVHRDIKPGNIMLEGTEPGGPANDFVKLVDFGISKAAYLTDTPTTKTGMSMGTPGYAAPEQYLAARNVDHRADIYAACVVLYKMLAGCLPFEAESYEQMVVQVCTQAPASLATMRADLSPTLVAIVDKGLQIQPDERHATARELRDALAVAIRGADGEPNTVRSGVSPLGPEALGNQPVPWSSGVLAVSTAQPDPAKRTVNLWAVLAGAALFIAVSGAAGYAVWATGIAEPPEDGSTSDDAPGHRIDAPPPSTAPPTVVPASDEVAPVTPEAPPTPSPEPSADTPPEPGTEPETESGSSSSRRELHRHRPRPFSPDVRAQQPSPPPQSSPPPADPFQRPGLVPFDR